MDLDIEYINSLIKSGETFKGLIDLFLFKIKLDSFNMSFS